MDKHLFLGANTADGLVHYFDRLVEMYDLKKLYILKGGNGVGKSTLMRKFARAFEDQCSITYLYCSGDPKSLDAVVIESLQVAIVDGTHPHPLEPKYPGLIDEIINLGEFIDSSKLTVTKSKIDEITAKKRAAYSAAFKKLSEARELHKKIEEFYTPAVDFKRVDELCDELISRTRKSSEK